MILRGWQQHWRLEKVLPQQFYSPAGVPRFRGLNGTKGLGTLLRVARVGRQYFRDF
jgi:hypothetical protein